ncbi:hypothetical protein B0H63DRAFT_21907 [Podospora didyma]|uniref:Uncharacterized protein n=1 Tax=Podospora didyma TaxID=330526 RepID=A0AAE0P5F4_9PEZI|nr:hypothetical protein B0H63DRAFT_21907 [Podospora didyma]
MFELLFFLTHFAFVVYILCPAFFCSLPSSGGLGFTEFSDFIWLVYIFPFSVLLFVASLIGICKSLFGLD